MPSIKDLKKRIGSVKNTQQTTKAMKMVSAAKLRRAQDAIQATRPYAKALGGLMAKASRLAGGKVSSPLLASDSAKPQNERKLLLVVVTSDRGLCGAFNANSIKTAQRWMAANASRYAAVELAFVGRRGNDFFKTKPVSRSGIAHEIGARVTVAFARDFSAKVVGEYLAGRYDEVKFVYNEFKNVMSQTPVVEDFLPLAALPVGDEGTASATESASDERTIVRPSAEVLLEQLLGKHFSVQTLRILLESQAGEHGARMSAMENATKNAGEMIRKLTLQFNKQRQASITKELLEIIAGSESQKANA